MSEGSTFRDYLNQCNQIKLSLFNPFKLFSTQCSLGYCQIIPQFPVGHFKANVLQLLKTVSNQLKVNIHENNSQFTVNDLKNYSSIGNRGDLFKSNAEKRVISS